MAAQGDGAGSALTRRDATACPPTLALPLDSPFNFVSAPSSIASSSALPSPTSSISGQDGVLRSSKSRDRGGRRLLMRQPCSGSLSPSAELANRAAGEQGDYFGGRSGPQDDCAEGQAESSQEDKMSSPCSGDCEAYDEACFVDCKERIDFLSRLPEEIRTHILCLFNDHRDVLRASQVSRAWNKHTRSPHIWRNLFASRAEDGWSLVPQHDQLWSALLPLRKAAHSLAGDGDMTDAQSLQLGRLDRNWIIPLEEPSSSSSGTKDVSKLAEDGAERAGGGTLQVEEDTDEDETMSIEGSYTSAAESSSDLSAGFDVPSFDDEALLGRLNWQLLYAARHSLNNRWHKSNALPAPKTQQDVEDFLQQDHSQLPFPLQDLPDEYRHDVLMRSQWRDRHWQENYLRYHDTWLRTKKYMPGIQYLTGHTDSIYCIRFDSRAFSLPEDTIARLRGEASQASTFTPLESFGPGSRGRIVTGSRDKTIRVWDGDTGMCLHTLEGHTGSVLCLEYDDNVLLSGSSDMTVRVWDLSAMYRGQAPTVMKTLRGHRAGVLDLAMKGRWVISCGKDWTVRVYDRDNDYELVHVFKQHSQAVNAGSLCVYEGSVKAVTASGEGAILLWDVETGQTLKRFTGHVKGLACVKFVDNVVISGSNDWTVRVWDTRTTRCLAELRGHWDLVRAICYAPGRNMVLTGGYDGAIKMYDVSAEIHPDSVMPNDENGRPTHWYQDEQVSVPPFEPHMPRIFDVQCDGTRVISCGESDRVCVRDFAAGCPLMRLFA